jgi:Short C-terminal domain
MALFGKGDWLDGEATVTREQPTEWLNGDPGEGIHATARKEELTLNVRVGGGAPYEVEWSGWVPLSLSKLLERRTIPVKVHPKKPAKLAPQWDDYRPSQAVVTGVAEVQSFEDVQRLLAERGISLSVTNADVTIVHPDEERIARLEKLAKLRDEGTLTQAEFEAQKAKLLGER